MEEIMLFMSAGLLLGVVIEIAIDKIK